MRLGSLSQNRLFGKLRSLVLLLYCRRLRRWTMRSGRGTLCRIQELLVGPNGHVPLNIHTWNKGENSKQAMVGKRVGIFHDVRLKEAKAYGAVSYDPGGLEYQSLQALLEIIAGD